MISWRSIEFRLATWYSLLLLAGLVSLGAVLWFGVNYSMVSAVDVLGLEGEWFSVDGTKIYFTPETMFGSESGPFGPSYLEKGQYVELKVSRRNDEWVAVEVSLEAGPEQEIFEELHEYSLAVPPEELNRIFDRFYRFDASRNRSKGGFGLGLSIAKSISESHGGTITVSSEVGKGSVFQVRLPWNNRGDKDASRLA